ncbi:MAG TPA: formylglycine-generating enzyme family protein [Polyangiaceae bacterium]|jgi:formylglycine-generating enzyme required for sulfatase activity|nr:formylglycine-generating enzyme family protein [Polyangiaceae bacterium]
MNPARSTLVVLIAAATGALLGRAAGAGADPRPAVWASATDPVSATGASPAAVLSGAASPAAPSSSAAHEDESDEPRPDATGENPYDSPTPVVRPAAPRFAIPARDGMLRLPGGHFTMGSASGRAPANERPVRPEVVAPFWIDRTEVTVAAYRACVAAGVCPHPERASATCTFDADDPDLPVSCVHWADADAYCGYVGKRLPSEREWEYAARGAFALPFPWGAGPSCGNAITLINEQTGRSCARRPTRVGTHPGGASVFGVQDMSGNVEEWTADWYVEMLGPGPAPRSGAAHVLRGGGWLSTPSQSRTTSRNWGSAVEAGANVGFRCVRDSEPTP